ncbi:hypothetical protein EsH8_II_000028 [Colletotrichum jinshuiense]
MATPKKKILFLCNRDYGQANVVLSATYALLQISPDVEVHIGSQAGIDSQMRRFVEQCTNIPGAPTGSAVKIHHLPGLSHYDALDRPGNPSIPSWLTTPGLINTTRNLLDIPGLVLPWSPEEFIEIYRSIETLVQEVKPDVTIAETFFAPAITFCQQAKINWACLAPNTIKEFALPLQPKLQILWKYPIGQSSLPYPVPFHMIPANIFYNLVVAYALLTDKRYERLSACLEKHIGPNIKIMTFMELGFMKAPPDDLQVLVANSPDIDLPFETLPSYITPCGPITRAAPNIETEDPELASWLGRGPTVYINLGTHHFYDLALATEFAHAIKSLLDAAQESSTSSEDQGLQVLWKMPRKLGDGEDQAESSESWLQFRKIMSPYVERDRVRIMNWFTAEPKSILESGHVVCSVNHGGSNSFHEAICTGIPQVVLPGWGDCYDFGIRAEFLGIGKWGNQRAKPYWERHELVESLNEVVLGPNAHGIQERAAAIAKRHPEGAGREKAAREILKLLDRGKEV